jgi:hypothetical protein
MLWLTILLVLGVLEAVRSSQLVGRKHEHGSAIIDESKSFFFIAGRSKE